MDPNETLKYIRYLQAQLNPPEKTTLEEAGQIGLEIAELFEALDQWLSKGGFLPAD